MKKTFFTDPIFHLERRKSGESQRFFSSNDKELVAKRLKEEQGRGHLTKMVEEPSREIKTN